MPNAVGRVLSPSLNAVAFSSNHEPRLLCNRNSSPVDEKRRYVGSKILNGASGCKLDPGMPERVFIIN